MNDPKMPKWQLWAQFRFAVIGELLSCPPPGGQLQKAIDRLARQHYQHPTDPTRRICLGRSTIERWYYKAKTAADPIAALGRKIRRDAGIRWSVSETLLSTLKTQYEAHRRWNIQLHYDNLKALARHQPHIGPIPSYKTVLRCMRDNGWIQRREPAQPSQGQQLAAQRIEHREVRSFEVRHVHGLWHLDFHQAKIRILDAAGTWHRPMALAILDDHSRLCCHLQFYLAETAECLVHGLIQAFMKRGLPRALMSDNGAAMLAEETRRGLQRLGIEHKTTLPYSPYQNGKQEAFWGQLESRLIELLRGVGDLKLSFINQAAQAWVEQDYHHKHHNEIKTTPLQRMIDGVAVCRPAPGIDTLRLAFTRRICRTPRRSDATVVVDGIRYELPARFAHLRQAVLRAPSWDKSRMDLVDADTDAVLARLLPQDKAKNASAIRRTVQDLPAKAPVEPPDQPLPALLRQWLADYAATGLPPAYLPKEEITLE
ncbi:MAG: DDE-type integrase/transposase/recombinase [Desulfobacteraceae bacterium]|nr:DDE-type integrase/transposase/recombinase [Desulfobacteraceae bacterium]